VLRLRHRFNKSQTLWHRRNLSGVKPRKAKKARLKLRLVSSSRARMTEGSCAASLGAFGIGSPADGANFGEFTFHALG